jgi:hypothetical protein
MSSYSRTMSKAPRDRTELLLLVPTGDPSDPPRARDRLVKREKVGGRLALRRERRELGQGQPTRLGRAAGD